MKKVSIDIPKPCQENWSEMTKKEQGRFCQSCQTVVVDFTAMSDAELFHYFSNHKGNTCGRISKEKLNKVIAPVTPSFTPNWLKVGLLASGLLTAEGIYAQVSPQIEISEQRIDQLETVNSQLNEEGEKMTISGKLTEENGEPLIFANVALKVGDVISGTASDIDGNYSLVIPEQFKAETSWTLVVSYIGFESKTIVVQNTKELNIQQNVVLDAGASILVGDIVCTYNYERTAWGYIKKWTRPVFQNIKNWKEERKEKRLERKALATRTAAFSRLQKSALKQSGKETTIKKLKAYPNPFTNLLQVHYQSEYEEVIEIKIFNALGQIIFTKKQAVVMGENTFELTPNIPTGTYWLSLSSNKSSQVVHTIQCLQEG